MSSYKWTKVAIDDTEIPAYLNPDEEWNGFARPYFRKDDVGLINEMLNGLGGEEHLVYDWETDIFLVCSDGEIIDGYRGTDIDGMHLYPIGNGSWIWLEA